MHMASKFKIGCCNKVSLTEQKDDSPGNKDNIKKLMELNFRDLQCCHLSYWPLHLGNQCAINTY